MVHSPFLSTGNSSIIVQFISLLMAFLTFSIFAGDRRSIQRITKLTISLGMAVLSNIPFWADTDKDERKSIQIINIGTISSGQNFTIEVIYLLPLLLTNRLRGEAGFSIASFATRTISSLEGLSEGE